MHADDVSVDLVLPGGVALTTLIPSIVDILGDRHVRYREPPAVRYQLALPGQAALDASKSLAQHGIRDGAVLSLFSSPTALAPPCFNDDAAEAVSATLLEHARPWTTRASQLAGALAAIWLAGLGALMLIRTMLVAADARHVGAATAVAAGAGCGALLAAVMAHRGFDDAVAGLALSLLATGFAAVAGALAVPGEVSAAKALLAAAAAAVTAVVAIHGSGCGTTTLTAVACAASVGALAALLRVAAAAPLQAVCAASAVISLALLQGAPRLSVMLAGLSPRLAAEPADEPLPELEDLRAKVFRADTWLTSLVGAFAVSSAFGAADAAVTTQPRMLGVAFAALTGVALLARARSQRGIPRVAVLVVTGSAALSVAFVVAATANARHVVWIAASAPTLAAIALTLGFIVPAITFSPVAQRFLALLECLVLAAIAPLACWICGFYTLARGLTP
ncbi:type VII secretion integral membrane protein EccD [Mycobacterium kyorinense]|uniref:Type VII secretion integral membrane protein EccD n=1 Tax=Mycobacterium kyorinense TaxID=487514 RepID=A0A1A2ZIL3_9MYCO|nr:type VII secretion integral membrane protein EccD [Mycobacterium kyorinense]